MTEKETKKPTDKNFDRFMLDPNAIVILKNGDKKKCDPNDKTCKLD